MSEASLPYVPSLPRPGPVHSNHLPQPSSPKMPLPTKENMKEAKAKRLRFAILTARSRIFPERLTKNQRRFLEAVSPDELMIGDFGTTKAHEREYVKQYAKYRSQA